MDAWRQELVESHLNMVRKIANQVHRTLPRDVIEVDDLIAMGTLGLYEAAERYDPRSGNRFITFSWYRVKGAILDGVRRNSLVRTRRAVKAEECATDYLSQAFPAGGPQHASPGAALGALGDSLKNLAAIYMISMDTTEAALVDEGAPDPEEASTTSLLLPRLKENLHRLEATERRVIEAVYYEDRTLKEVSEELGHSRSWGCRVHAKAIEKLREGIL